MGRTEQQPEAGPELELGAVADEPVGQGNARRLKPAEQASRRLATDERRTAQMAALAELGELASSGTAFQTLLDAAVGAAADGLETSSVTLLERLPDGATFELRAGVGCRPNTIGRARVPVRPASDADDPGQPTVGRELALTGGLGGTSVMIQGEHAPFGVLSVHSRHPRTFSRGDRAFLEALASMVAQAAARKSTEQLLRERNRQLEARIEQRTGWLGLMQATATAANEARSSEQAARRIIEQVCQHSGWRLGLAFVRRDGDVDDQLRLLDVWGIGDWRGLQQAVRGPYVRGVRCGEGLVGRVLQTGQPAWGLTRDAAAMGFACADEPIHPRLQTGIALPARVGDDTLAVLLFFSERLVCVDDRLLEVMAHVGTQLGRVIERELAERRLRESEYFTNSVVNTAPMLLFVVSLDGPALVYANSQVQAMLGHRVDRLRGLGPEVIDQLIHRSDWRRIRSAREHLEDRPPGSVIEVEHRLRRADGMWRWFATRLVSFARNDSGEVRQVLGIAEDITARKRAEEALGESEQRFHAVFECAALGIGLIEPTGRFVAANPAMQEMLGYSEAQLQDKHISELTHADDLLSEQNRVVEVLAGELERFEMEKRLVCADGRELWAQVATSLIRDQSGRPRYAIVIVEDVTDRKNLDKELADSAVREQQRIGQDLHDRVGQELTGLGYLAQSLYLTMDQAGHKQADEAHRLAEGLRGALQHVRTLSRGLFPVDVDIRSLQVALGQLVRMAETQYGLTCRLRLDADPPIDDSHAANHLFRIVQEAVRNAAQHGKASRLDVTSQINANGRFEVMVEDDGQGVPADHEQASGMGLRIMRHRASVIGADLSIEARPDGGTRVRCTFRQA
ncbi:MAG: PAS domain S-box protein [Phycisphaeraceae bacterium]